MYFEITEHHDYRESLHEITFETVILLMQLVPSATDLKPYCVQITNERWNMKRFALENELILWKMTYDCIHMKEGIRIIYVVVIYGH